MKKEPKGQLFGTCRYLDYELKNLAVVGLDHVSHGRAIATAKLQVSRYGLLAIVSCGVVLTEPLRCRRLRPSRTVSAVILSNLPRIRFIRRMS